MKSGIAKIIKARESLYFPYLSVDVFTGHLPIAKVQVRHCIVFVKIKSKIRYTNNDITLQ